MKIAVGNSRMDKKWKNQDISWADLCARCGSTIRTTETVEHFQLFPVFGILLGHFLTEVYLDTGFHTRCQCTDAMHQTT